MPARSIRFSAKSAAIASAAELRIPLLTSSLTTAAAVLTGNWIGSGRPDRAAHYGRQTYKLGTYYSVGLAIVLIAILISAVGVMNSILMSVFERTSEIGVLKALGAGQRTIRTTSWRRFGRSFRPGRGWRSSRWWSTPWSTRST